MEEVSDAKESIESVQNGNQQTEKKKSRGHRCYFCGVKFTDIRTLKRHITTHRDRPFECEVCKKCFIDSSTLRKHKLIHTGVRAHLCEFCGKTFRHNWERTKHVNQNHSLKAQPLANNTPPQPKATKSSKFNWILSNQDALGIEILEFGKSICKLCHLNFEDTSSLIEHVVMHYKNGDINLPIDSKIDTVLLEESFPCAMCQKEFKTLADLSCHWLVHSNATPFQCQHCDAKFKQFSLLKRHEIIHSEEKLFGCMQCEEAFRTIRELNHHMVLHEEDRPYVCLICKHTFKAASILKKHALIHQDEKPYECSTCGSRFKVLFSLKQHQMSHSNYKQYSCGLCNKSYKYRVSYNRHLRVHSGEYPFKCVFCEKQYRSSKSLRIHLPTHQNREDSSSISKEQTCPICKKTLQGINRLHKHMLRHSKSTFLVNSNEENK